MSKNIFNKNGKLKTVVSCEKTTSHKNGADTWCVKGRIGWRYYTALSKEVAIANYRLDIAQSQATSKLYDKLVRNRPPKATKTGWRK